MPLNVVFLNYFYGSVYKFHAGVVGLWMEETDYRYGREL
jgi:hypothetical protein